MEQMHYFFSFDQAHWERMRQRTQLRNTGPCTVSTCCFNRVADAGSETCEPVNDGLTFYWIN